MAAPRTAIAGTVVAAAALAGLLAWRTAGTDGADAASTTAVTSTAPGPPSPTTTFFAALPRPEPAPPAERDPLTWPFAATSIWNTPIGLDARRVPAGLSLGSVGVTADEDVLVLTPDAPLVDILAHDGGWDPEAVRCASRTGAVLYRGVPVPEAFVTDPGYLGRTPNHAAAVLLADGDTVVQTQPLHRCGPGGPVVSQYRFPEDRIRTGDGIAGAHGGSGMSSLGGTLRLGELVPGGAVRHALKVNLDCATFCAYDRSDPDGTPGFRWPARAADADAATRYGGTLPALQMGALLALPADFPVASLRTEPARMIARALIRYGAYVVDDTGYPTFALTTEWSPGGRVVEEFERAWGFPLHGAAEAGCTDDGPGCAWTQDVADLLPALEVVDDNGPASVGGAGVRAAPCAPPFAARFGVAPQPLPSGCAAR